MKKNILFLFATAIILFSSCVKKEVVIPNVTVVANVLPSDWQYSSASQTYFVQINVPEIDAYANSYDGIIVSFTAGNNVYEAVPEVYNGDSYSFTHQPGSITLEVQGANGSTVTPPSYAIQVKVVIIPSN